MDDNYLESSLDLRINAPHLQNYNCAMHIKQDLTEVENLLLIDFLINNNDQKKDNFMVNLMWSNFSASLIKAHGELRTSLLPMDTVQTSLSLMTENREEPSLHFDLSFINNVTGLRYDYGCRANKHEDIFNAEIWSPIPSYRNISIHGFITQSQTNPNEYQFSGNLYRNMSIYHLTGLIKMPADLDANGSGPSSTVVYLNVQPKLKVAQQSTSLDSGAMDLRFSKIIGNNGESKQYVVHFDAKEGGDNLQIDGEYLFNNKNGLNLILSLQSSLEHLRKIQLSSKVSHLEKNRVSIEINLKTPWQELALNDVALYSDITLHRQNGDVTGSYRISNEKAGNGSLHWSWLWPNNMNIEWESYLNDASSADSSLTNKPRTLNLIARYLNQENTRFLARGAIEVNRKWQLDLDGNVNYQSCDNIAASLRAQLPQPVEDVHNFEITYQGNLISNQGNQPEIDITGQYTTKKLSNKYLSRLLYTNKTHLHGLGYLEWGTNNNVTVLEADLQVQPVSDTRKDFKIELITPYYSNNKTLAVGGVYEKPENQPHHLK